MRLSSGIVRWWRSPGAAHAVSRGGRGGGKSPAREANGSRWSPRADGAAERRSRLLRRKLLPAVVPVTPTRPPPSSAHVNTGLHMK